MRIGSARERSARKTVLDLSGATSSGSRPEYASASSAPKLDDAAADLVTGQVDLPDRVAIRREQAG